MILDVDESLRALIRRDVLAGSQVDVVLDAPTKEWSARRNAPTLNCFLYDIREAVTQRVSGEQMIRGDDGRVVSRRPWPRRFRLSYLVTAWTQRPEDEHRMLGAVLGVLLRFDALPPDILTGVLTEARESVQLSVGVPPPQDRAISDIWSALGGELKPSLDVVLTAPFDAGMAEKAGPPVAEPLVVRTWDRIDERGVEQTQRWPVGPDGQRTRVEADGHRVQVRIDGQPVQSGPDGEATTAGRATKKTTSRRTAKKAKK